MKVDAPLPGKPAAVRRRRLAGDATGVRFADAVGGSAETADARPPEQADSPVTSAPVGALLTLQTSAGPEGDAATVRARMRAEELLRRLDLLRVDLLGGSIPRAQLIGLAQSLKTLRDQTFDPRLEAVLDAIDLRAQVELAKYVPYR